jgi:hypothetical protein
MTPLPRLYRGATQDLMTARSTAGADQIYEFPQDELGVPTFFSVDVISLGTGASVDIEGSDDPTFPPNATIKLQTAIPVGHKIFSNQPVRFIRANQTAITSGTSTVRATNLGRG